MRKRLFIKVALPIMVFSVLLNGSPAKAKDYYTDHARNPLVYVEMATYILSSSFVSIFFHESAHYLTARAFGINDLTMEVGFLSGSVSYPASEAAKLSTMQRNLISIAGYSTNRLLAFGTNEVMDATQASGWAARWGGDFLHYKLCRTYRCVGVSVY